MRGAVTPSTEIEPERFFLPGPTRVHPDVQQAMTRPMIGHRGGEMHALMDRLQPPLRALFRTQRPVYVAAASATGLMEAGLRNAGAEQVLCLVNGAFSERFADIAAAIGSQVVRLEVEWGRAHDPDDVARALRSQRVDAVTVVHSETSTGVLNPVAEIAAVVRAGSDATIIVDTVSSLAGAPVETDAWGVDFLLTGSQKALALPPGLALGVASERMLERARLNPQRGYYFDLLAFEEQMERKQTPTTPPLSLLYGLECQLGRIHEEGLEQRWQRHRAMAERMHAFVDRHADRDLAVLAPPGRRSPTVSCVLAPGRGVAVCDAMAERGWVLAPGYGPMKERCFRVGHMGEHAPPQFDALLDDLAHVVHDV